MGCERSLAGRRRRRPCDTPDAPVGWLFRCLPLPTLFAMGRHPLTKSGMFVVPRPRPWTARYPAAPRQRCPAAPTTSSGILPMSPPCAALAGPVAGTRCPPWRPAGGRRTRRLRGTTLFGLRRSPAWRACGDRFPRLTVPVAGLLGGEGEVTWPPANGLSIFMIAVWVLHLSGPALGGSRH